jgi:hypothetical protein
MTGMRLCDVCINEQQQREQAAIRETASAAREATEAERARVAALPQMSVATLTEYFRSRSGSIVEYNGERPINFSSLDVAAADDSGRTVSSAYLQ